jgi:hypothetical protein
MNLIYRDSCPITGENDLELLHSFKKFPIFMGCVNNHQNNDILSDMNWFIGKKNGVIQLNPLIPLETLYSQSHGSGTVGKLWELHHKSFAEFISKFKLQNILEIGSGHGKLIKNYFSYYPESKWTVVEPNPKIQKDRRIKVYKGLFDESFSFNNNIEGVVHSHVIEHLYFPLNLLRNIYNKIRIGTFHIFSVPNLEVMIEKKYTNALNFEHTLFLNEELIEEILEVSGFEIIEKKKFMEDHSIFYATKKIDICKKKYFSDNYKKNKKIYKEYLDFHKELVANINKKIDKTKTEIYLFGAHVFSQFLLNFGLKENKIKCILDNDKKKQDKRLYGTNLKVYSPKILKSAKNATVILRSGVYNNEIKNDIINNINKNIVFWE